MAENIGDTATQKDGCKEFPHRLAVCWQNFY